MTNPNLGRRKQKITYTACSEGVEKAERALKRLGFESKSNFAKSQLISRSTVTKFFQFQPIQLDSFKKICDALTLKWTEIAELSSDVRQSKRLKRNDCSNSAVKEEVEMEMSSRRQVTVIDKQDKTVKAQIILKGDINSVSNFKILEFILREHSGDTIKINDIQEGSIKLTVEGSQGDIQKLVEHIQSGELTEVNGFPVEEIQILDESSDDNKSNEFHDKWDIVQGIVYQSVKRRNLSSLDLSDTDLSDADLSDADLSDADLSDADLSDANLSGAKLSNANLSGASFFYVNFSGADLSDADLSNADLSGVICWNTNLCNVNLKYADLKYADLRYADLRGANLKYADLGYADLRGANFSSTNFSNANVKNARFINSTGISESMKLDLIQRGAYFEDFSDNNNSSIYSPKPSPIPSRR